MRDAVYAIAAGNHAWFAAWRGAGVPQLAPGAVTTLMTEADFALIGAADAYWSRFAIFTSDDDTPPSFGDDVEDAFIAKVSLLRPPRLMLSVLKTLVSTGILSKPRGELVRDAQALGFRADAMPSAAAIDNLLARPPAYQPAMINFLAYKPNGGRVSYARYGRVALRTVYRTGGRLLFYGRVTQILRDAKAGPTLGRWDDVAAMQYPAPDAILSMEHAPDYRAALVHRDAGLDRTVVIASHIVSGEGV